MKSWLRAVTLGALTLASLLSLSCGNKQELISIQVTPAQVNFQGFGAQSQMTAMGSYIHPPATKDITRAVTWGTDAPGEVSVSQTGLVTAINTCGSGQVTATAYSNPANPAAGSAIRGTADVAILLNGSPNCSQLANLTVTIGGGFPGTVASSPSGITCPSVCSSNFAVGTTVTLTASPSGGSTFSTWSGCDSMSGNICVVTMSAARTVTANFT
ncbi:MAG TPA: Ig-like domain-containing protein [Terriglobales bacterium]